MNNQQPTPEQKIKKAKTILWLGIIVIIVVGLAVAVYFLFIKTAGQGNVNVVQNINAESNINRSTNVAANVNTSVNTNTQVDTSNWLTYRSDKFGYKFKYPSDWKIAQDFESDYEGRWVVMDGTDNMRYHFSLHIFVPLDSSCSSLESCTQLAALVVPATGIEVSALSPAEIAGKRLIKQVKKSDINTAYISYNYFLYDSGNLYDFFISKDAPYSENNIKSLFDQIITTFEFTKEDRSFKNDVQIDISNWETYQNEKYYYTFKKPKDLILDRYEYTPENTHFHGYGIWHADYEISIDASTPSDCSTLNECVQKHRVNFVDPVDETSELSSVKIADKSALNEKIISSRHRYNNFYLYESNNFYTLETSSMIVEEALTKPIIDKILSTFQFTK